MKSFLLFIFSLGLSSQASATLLGHVDRIAKTENGVRVMGWACLMSYDRPVTVQVRTKSGKDIATKTTSSSSEAAIHRLCATKSSVTHRFSINIPLKKVLKHEGQEIRVKVFDPTKPGSKKLSSEQSIFLPSVSEMAQTVLRQLDCFDTKAMYHGYLCAIQPSFLDPKAKDIAGTRTFTQRALGYGYHVVAIPKNTQFGENVLIHFTGTAGRPYNQNFLQFGTTSFLNEAMSRGRTVIQVAYNNTFSVNETCGGRASNIDNCAGILRQQKLIGGNHFLDNTTVNDSIEYRLEILFSYLSSLNASIHKFKTKWKKLEVSGHSQGAGFAHYIAKFHGVKRACLIAGGYDRPDNKNHKKEQFADWILESGMATRPEHINGVVHTDDIKYQVFRSVYDLLGLYDIGNVQEVDVQPMTSVSTGESTEDGHSGILGAYETRRARVIGCFH